MAEVEHLVRHAAAETRSGLANVPLNLDAIVAGDISGAEKQRIIGVIGDEIVNRAARRAQEAGATDVSTRVVNGDYDDGILEMAKDVGADTIVIGQRGLGRVQRMFQGSVSKKVNEKAECTVVTVR